MKLVIVGPYPLGIDKIKGGVEAILVYLIEGLKRIDDLDINVISCRREIAEAKIIYEDDVKMHFLPSSRRFGNITLGIMDRYRIREKIREINPEIIHSHEQTSHSYAALETGYPIVITVHGIEYKEVELRKGIFNRIRKFPIAYIERICLSRATDIISISPYAREMVTHLTKARIYPLENPISDKYFQIENFGVSNKILFVGVIIERKNILALLQAVNILKREIPGIELRIVGNIGDPYYLEVLKNYIKKNNIENNITFLGPLSEERIVEEYRKCCLLVLPSFEESSGTAIQQAMAAGKAVIATRVGGIPYLVEDGKTGFLVDSGDIKGLAEKIKLLNSNKDLRTRFEENAKQEAIKRFKPEKIARTTYQVYQEILRRKGGLR